MLWHYMLGSHETPNISSVTVHWVGVTSLDEVITSCDSSRVAHPWDCVELPSQIVTFLLVLIRETVWNKVYKLWLSFISHPWDYGTNFAQSFFFPINVMNLPTNSWLMCSCSFINFSVIWCILAIDSETFAAFSRSWAVNSHPLFESSSGSSHSTLNLLNHSKTCTR